MKILTDIFVIIVAIEALGIMLFEMFGSQSTTAQKAFNASAAFLQQPEAKKSMANQGLYNGFLGVGILVARFAFPSIAIFPGLLLFLSFVIIAAIFGAMTVNKQIFFTQGLPAVIALICLLFANSLK